VRVPETLLILFVVLLIIGAATSPTRGESWDAASGTSNYLSSAATKETENSPEKTLTRSWRVSAD
jgi:hypothetical protein